jgi:DNA replication initiation complex subunit (GINS family)
LADDIVISYETLFELLRIERSRTELQSVPDSYIEEIKKMIDSELAALEIASDDEKKKKEMNIKSTLKIIKEIYERREKKIVNMAIDKSRTKSAIIDYSRFLEHEKKLFEELVGVLDRFRDENAIKAKVEEKKTEEAETKNDPVQKEEPTKEPIEEKKDMLRTVRFLNPFPKFLGEDLKEYGPFDEEEIVNLPEIIANLLVKKGRAEEINITD